MKIKKLEYYSSSEGGKTWIWERHPNIEDITDKINEIIDKLNERDDAEPITTFVSGTTTEVEFAPVKHGKWISHGCYFTCSVCGEEQYGIDTGRFYCQNCGAKMDLDEVNDEVN